VALKKCDVVDVLAHIVEYRFKPSRNYGNSYLVGFEHRRRSLMVNELKLSLISQFDLSKTQGKAS
jgi:hypothetical protein